MLSIYKIRHISTSTPLGFNLGFVLLYRINYHMWELDALAIPCLLSEAPIMTQRERCNGHEVMIGVGIRTRIPMEFVTGQPLLGYSRSRRGWQFYTWNICIGSITCTYIGTYLFCMLKLLAGLTTIITYDRD